MKNLLTRDSCSTTKAILLFTLYPILFWATGYLGFSHAGEIAITGVGSIALATLISQVWHRYSIARVVPIVVSLVFFLYMSFFGALRDIFGMAQDNMMVMQAIYGTDSSEALEFFDQYWIYIIKHLIIFIVAFGSYYLLLFYQSTTCDRSISRKVIMGWILLFVITHLERPMRHADPFFYFSFYHSVWQEELREAREIERHLSQIIPNSITNQIQSKSNNTLVWVIGESSTKSNWSLYGYNRDTTPKINSIKDNLLVFDHIYAAAPITIPAIEMMLTTATVERPELWKEEPDIILLAKMAGYHTYWISNHTTDAFGILSIFAHHADETILTNQGKARGEGSYDESVLPAYKKALNDVYKKKLIIVHLLESHPAYNYRYPSSYAKFTNTFDDSVAQELSDKGRAKWAILFRNTYDNSVLYSDMMHYKLLTMLQSSTDANNSSYLYHPDHGEDVLHHTNFSGHNPRAIEQWQIPMIYWDNNISRYKNRASQPYRLDSINHTILGLLRIESIYYDSKEDILSSNFKARIIKSVKGFR